MKIVLQRVSRATVSVESKAIAEIPAGLMLLVGFGEGDNSSALAPMAEKIANLRVFPNEAGRFDRSVIDIAGGVLLVPNFTLYGETKKGRRPDFFSALDPKLAEPLFEEFVGCFEQLGISPVGRGEFGAHMHVELCNDGPVTLILED